MNRAGPAHNSSDFLFSVALYRDGNGRRDAIPGILRMVAATLEDVHRVHRAPGDLRTGLPRCLRTSVGIVRS